MNEYFPWMIAVAGVAASYYTFRWGHDEGRAVGFELGHAEGLEDARSNGLRERTGVVTANAAGGAGAVPR